MKLPFHTLHLGKDEVAKDAGKWGPQDAPVGLLNRNKFLENKWPILNGDEGVCLHNTAIPTAGMCPAETHAQALKQILIAALLCKREDPEAI